MNTAMYKAASLKLPFRTFLCSFLICSAMSLFAEESVPVVYVGSIPDQIHTFGPADIKPLKLQIKSSSLSSSTFSMEGAPATCTISAGGLFQYTPTASDNSSFSVTVKAVQDTLSESQEFMIMPGISIPEDAKCFNYVNASFPPPETESKDYILVTETKSDVGEFFNTMNRETRTAAVSGMTVVIQKGHENGIYEKFCSYKDDSGNDINVNLKELTITAEKIVVRSKACFPKTRLNLFANEIVFESNAAFDTTPIAFSKRASDYVPATATSPAIDAKEGHDGETGGNIRIMANKITVPDIKKIYFTANGSQGQGGGNGENGDNGANRDTMAGKGWLWPSHNYWFPKSENPDFHVNTMAAKYPICIYQSKFTSYKGVDKYLKDHTTAAVFKPGFGNSKASCGYVLNWEPHDWKPGDGTDAKNPGAGGNGGDAGKIEYLNVPNTYLKSDGGVAGVIQGSLPKGGEAGKPCPAFAMEGYGFPLSDCRFYFWGYDTRSRNTENITGIHFSKNGKDATPPTAAKSGAAAAASSLDASMSWLHPLATAQALKYIKAACMNGQFDYAKTVSERWAQYCNDALGQLDDDKGKKLYWYQYYSPALDGLDSNKDKNEITKRMNRARTEISQQAGEFKAVLSNMSSGLDFYGNPAGWTPMISFELSVVAFRQQIDHSIDTMYLTYWLKNTTADNENKLKGLWRLRNETGKNIKECRDELAKLDIELPKLEKKAGDTDRLEEEAKSSLAALNNRLQMDAAKTVKNKRIASTVFKSLSVVASLVPVGQPMLGQLGSTLADTVTNAVNGDAAGAVTSGLGGITKAFNKSGIKGCQKSLYAKYNDDELDKYYNPGPQGPDSWDVWKAKYQNDDPLGDYLNGVASVGGGLAGSVKKLSDVTGENAASDTEVQAEIKKLQEQSTEYKELGKKVAELADEKKKVAEQLMQACAKIASYSNKMTDSLNAIDSIQEQVLQREAAVDSRLDSYLDQLSKRAEENLVRYHYYLKKSYEYRMLQEYAAPLDLSSIRDSIVKLVEVDKAGHTLSDAQFAQLKTLYYNIIWDMCAKLYEDIINMRKSLEFDSETTYEFHQSQLDALNRGEPLEINFRNTGLFGGEQGLRIRNIEISEMNVGLAPWASSPTNANFSVYFTHGGESYLRNAKGEKFLFRHYNSSSGDNKIVWGGKYTYTTNTVTPIVPSVAEASLLKTILTDKGLPNSDADMPIFCWPALDAKISIAKSQENKENKSRLLFPKKAATDSDDSFIIKGLKLRIQYSMLKQDSSVYELVVKSDEGASPTILIDKNDEQGNGSGRAPFSRFYKDSTVTITAPAQYGSAKFAKWTDSQGDSTGFTDPTNPVLSGLSINKNRTIVARYSYDISGTISNLTDSGGKKTSGAAIAIVSEDGEIRRVAYMEDKAQGTYKVTGLRPGKYTLTPSFYRNSFAPASQTVEIVADDVKDVNFSASPSAGGKNLVRGKIRTRDGASWEPFGEAKVTLVRNDGSGYLNIAYSSSRDGTFQFNGVAPGNYTVTPSYPTYTFSSSKDKDPSYTFDLSGKMGYEQYPNLIFNAEATTAFTAKGQVTGSGSDGVKITVKPSQGAEQSTFTDKDGKFSFMLTPDSYTFTPSKPGYSFKPENIKKKIDDKNVEDINFAIQKSAANGLVSISGRVYSLPGSSPATVRLHLRSGILGRTSTDENGDFIFRDVPADKYVVAPSFDGYRFSPETRTVRHESAKDLLFQAKRLAVKNDFNGDGKSDTIWTDADVAHFASFSGSIKGDAASSIPLDFASPCELVCSADFDGDGACELVGRKQTRTGAFILYSPLKKTKRMLWHGLGRDVSIAATGDFNGDGRAEIAWFNSRDCEIRIDRLLVGWDMAPQGSRIAFKTEDIEFLYSEYSTANGRDMLCIRVKDTGKILRARIGSNGVCSFTD